MNPVIPFPLSREEVTEIRTRLRCVALAIAVAFRLGVVVGRVVHRG